MVRVILLNASEHLHRASGVRFRPTQVGDVWLGVAEVDETVAAEHFASRAELFRVEALPSGVIATCEEAPDFAAMEETELRALAKLADVELPAHASKTELVAALHRAVISAATHKATTERRTAVIRADRGRR
jgi:hypothetical protein